MIQQSQIILHAICRVAIPVAQPTAVRALNRTRSTFQPRTENHSPHGLVLLILDPLTDFYTI